MKIVGIIEIQIRFFVMEIFIILDYGSNSNSNLNNIYNDGNIHYFGGSQNNQNN